MTNIAPRRTSQVAELRDGIRERILSGEFAPGAALPSAQLAQTFGVSRTPLREALRLLQEEGFVTLADNQRPRVASTSSTDLDAVYAQRITLSALCTSLTVPTLADDQLDDMRRSVEVMRSAHAAGDIAAWHAADRAFHSAHLGGAPDPLLTELRTLRRRCRYFFTIWAQHRPNEQPATVQDHDAILAGCSAHDAPAAAAAMAHHLHRIGSTLFHSLGAEHQPAAMDAALGLVTPPE